MIEVNNLSFSYGSNEILNNVSLSTEGRRIVSILGPNGSGKTTLLRCICGLLKYGSGDVFIKKRNLLDFKGSELSKVLGFVPQQSMKSGDTVFDSILIGRRPYVSWTPSRRDTELVWKIIQIMRLEKIALSPTSNISGGELQKVSIARALAQDPSIIVLDEPTNNLDVANQHMVMHMLGDICDQNNLSILMTMHDINLAAYYSDYLIFLNNRKIVAAGGHEILTSELIMDVYGIDCEIEKKDGYVFVIPKKKQPSFVRYNGLIFSEPDEILGR